MEDLVFELSFEGRIQAEVGRMEEKQLSICRKYHEQRHGDRKLQNVPSKSMSVVGEKAARADAMACEPELWLGGGIRGNLNFPQRVKFGDPPKDSEKRGDRMGAEHSPAAVPRRWRPERKVLVNSV